MKKILNIALLAAFAASMTACAIDLSTNKKDCKACCEKKEGAGEMKDCCKAKVAAGGKACCAPGKEGAGEMKDCCKAKVTAGGKACCAPGA